MVIENWNDILQMLMYSKVNKIISLLYILSWQFFGNYVLLNLVLGIMLAGFDTDALGDDAAALEEGLEIAPDIAVHSPESLAGSTATTAVFALSGGIPGKQPKEKSGEIN
jgi:hypothetical protein